MRKIDIGSVFNTDELFVRDELKIDPDFGWDNCYSLCREAIFDIANSIDVKRKVVLLPSYTCSTVIDPFVQLGWDYEFYGINRDLTINIIDFENKLKSIDPSVCIVHPFYGMDISQEVRDLVRDLKNCITIKDITQSIFLGDDSDFDFVVGSLRKWFAIPDGAFLFNHTDLVLNSNNTEFEEFCRKQVYSMYLRGKYFETKDENIKQISIQLNYEAEDLADENISCHSMSNYSLRLYKQYLRVSEIRIENSKYLFDNIIQTEQVQFVIKSFENMSSAPLYFPIYCKDRNYVQRTLAKNHIYAKTIWPVTNSKVLINKNAKFIYDHILALPIDQRYDESDMKAIADTINAEIKNIDI